MNVISVVCFGVSAVLAFIAGFYRPANPPPANLLAVAVGFLALAFVVQAVVPG